MLFFKNQSPDLFFSRVAQSRGVGAKVIKCLKNTKQTAGKLKSLCNFSFSQSRSQGRLLLLPGDE